MSIRGEVKSHREVANTTHTHHTPHQDVGDSQHGGIKDKVCPKDTKHTMAF